MIISVIQARMGSSRLPGKVMKKIDNSSVVLNYVIDQLKSSEKVEKILVATTDLKEDDLICSHLSSQNIDYFRGSSDDVLDRFYQCTKIFSDSLIVRITADNPLIDPKIIDLVITEFLNHNCDYATNSLKRTFPYGTEVEVFPFHVLEKAWKHAKMPSEREHVTPFIRDPKNNFNLFNIENNEDLSFLRYTVDRNEDLELVKEIIKNIDSRPILLKHILKLYKTKPEIFKINEHEKHDGYFSALQKDEQYLKSHKENQS